MPEYDAVRSTDTDYKLQSDKDFSFNDSGRL